MKPSPKSSLIYAIALLSAIWFLLTSWIWVYFFNIIISFPVGLISFFLWKKNRKDETGQRYEIVKYILLAGVASSVIWLIGLLVRN